MDAIAAQIRTLASTQVLRPAIPHRQWLEGDGISLYVRVGPRFVKGAVGRAITVASVEVDEEVQRQGRLTSLMGFVEEFATQEQMDFVVVESIMNPVMVGFLRRRGYEQIGEGIGEGIGADFVKRTGA